MRSRLHSVPGLGSRLVSIALTIMALGLSLPCFAQPTPEVLPQSREVVKSAANIPATGAVPLTREDVTTWLDGYMPYALQSGDVAGAVVVIVKDGQVLFEKGYGYADVERKTPVDPRRTLFRLGSVSKLFTWTAVMQLVEQGKLDLDADVNRYLDFNIPAYDGAPATLRQILTHTAGFADTLKGAYSFDPADILPLEGYLKAWTPPRIYQPGTTPAYSNYATALAGYIVQRVSGEPFDEYIERHILAPLGMEHTTLRQPLPERFKADMSTGYWEASGLPQPFEVYGPAPAGSASAAGSDVARFMIAHLQKGEYQGTRILEPETATKMHDTALTILPTLNRMLLGFYEGNRNGRRAIGHGGDTPLFHSAMHLFLDDGVGLFISLNSAGKDGATGPIRSALFEQFTDRYLPGPKPDGQVTEETAATHARMIAGTYAASRTGDTSFLSLLGLLGRTQVIAHEDNTISLREFQGINGVPKKWREIAPFVWRDVDGTDRLAAKMIDGQVVMFSIDEVSPFQVYLRPIPWTSGAWLLPALVISLGVLAVTVLRWPIGAFARRYYAVSFPLEGRAARACRVVQWTSLAVLLVFVMWVVTIMLLANLVLPITTATDPWLYAMRVLGLVVFVGGTIIAIWHARIVFAGERRWHSRLWSLSLVVACATVLWTAAVCHLLSFSSGY